MNPWYIYAAVILALVAVALVLFAVREAYQMKLHYHSDLISRLVANRLSLVWNPDKQIWMVIKLYVPTGQPIETFSSRWELAVENALDAKALQSRSERSIHGGRRVTGSQQSSPRVANTKD